MSTINSLGPGRLSPQTTALFVCDVQERFASVIYQFNDILLNGQLLVDAAKVLGLPTLITTQYKKAFGRTVIDGVEDREGATESDGDNRPWIRSYDKRKFSMVLTEEDGVNVPAMLTESNIEAVVIFGLETHVCVRQTCLDLLSRGIQVYVAFDAVSSQTPLDKQVAIDELRCLGVRVTTSQAILFDMLRVGTGDNFKKVSGLIKSNLEAQREKTSRL